MVSMDILDHQPTDPPTELGLLDAIDVLSNSNITVSHSHNFKPFSFTDD